MSDLYAYQLDRSRPLWMSWVVEGLADGKAAVVTHVEDEPEALYAQLVAEGLNPGMCVRIVDSTPERIRFEVEGEEKPACVVESVTRYLK